MKDITNNLVDYLITLHDRGVYGGNIWKAVKVRFDVAQNSLAPSRKRRFMTHIYPQIIREKIKLIQIKENLSVFMDLEIFEQIKHEIEDKGIPSIELLYTWDELSIFIPELHKPKIRVL